jgi:hypothetical protein
MAVSEQIKALVDQMPDPDGRRMYTQNIDQEKIEKAVEAICDAGRQGVEALVALLGEPGSADDVKPRYTLHALAHHVLAQRDETARRSLSETLAAELSKDRPVCVKRYLCEELQWVGRQEAASALGALLCDDELTEPASMALVAIRDGAAAQFRAALAGAKGRCRLNVIQGLGAVADAESVQALQQALADSDIEVRLAAGWGLAKIGAAGCVDALLKAADAEPGWERIQATRHCLRLGEKLAATGDRAAARRVHSHLRDTRTDPAEAYVREAAERALRAMS